MLPNSLRELLTNVIDYAGMYPPAQLPFDEALRNYIEYQSAPFCWMVGQYVCPIVKLGELRSCAELYSDWDDIPLALIGTSGASEEELVSRCAKDFAEYSDVAQPSWRPVSYEVRLEPELLRNASLANALRAAAENWPADVMFCEIPLLELSREEIERAINSIAAVDGGAAKFRLGGPNAAAYPDAAILANAIKATADANTSVKFTAGLHHPHYHHDHSIHADVHGFINVFCASVLACTHNLDSSAIERILRIAEPEAIKFDDSGFVVEGERATIGQIEEGRTFAVGFGSCSVMEPVEDLISLGYSFE